MGLSDEIGHDDATLQQHYFGQLAWYQHYGTPEQLAKFSAGGPPPPMKADGVTGKILWFEVHTPSVSELAALLAEMETAGWITVEVRENIAELSPADGIAELKARMVEQDSVRLTDRMAEQKARVAERDSGRPEPLGGTE
ncbi:hypothetical protein [Nocardia altamirensis]|uniref:hypothetical protein n=1 Tax=Nocardia altamirensis TaxID=472158 RepID=UPI00157C4D8A|nr:hypothetical protein [Nocardia altamirensis]